MWRCHRFDATYFRSLSLQVSGGYSSCSFFIMWRLGQHFTPFRKNSKYRQIPSEWTACPIIRTTTLSKQFKTALFPDFHFFLKEFTITRFSWVGIKSRFFTHSTDQFRSPAIRYKRASRCFDSNRTTGRCCG